MTDDSGSFTDGSVVNKAFIDAIYDEIDDQVHATSDPLVKPSDIIAEVVAARGASVDLEARLDATEADIALVGTPGQVLASVGKTNIVNNETFLMWHLGDALAPSMWLLVGAGGTVARCGTSLADTNQKIGDFCARIRRVAANTTLTQTVISGAAFTRAAPSFQSQAVGLGAWVRSTAIGGARIFIGDGIGTTYSVANTLANTWEWLSVQRVLDATATQLDVGIINDVNGADAYLSGVTAIIGDVGSAPTEWTPAPVEYVAYNLMFTGNAAVVANKLMHIVHRPGIVKDVHLVAGTVPTGADLIIDVNTWDGAAFTSMYTAGTRPRITAGARAGGATPDAGTYARRCLYPGFGGVGTAGVIAIDVDQIGSGVAGADVCVSVRVLHPLRFLESILTYNDI